MMDWYIMRRTGSTLWTVFAMKMVRSASTSALTEMIRSPTRVPSVPLKPGANRMTTPL